MSPPSPIPDECIEEVNHPRVTVRAHGRSATFLNSSRVAIKKIDVDCWLPVTTGPKSDYLLCKSGIVDVIVELKGKDIDHAIEQILATLKQWKSMGHCSPKTGALVVFTRSPKRSAVLDNDKLKLLTKHGIWLEMDKTGLRDYQFETFIGARR